VVVVVVVVLVMMMMIKTSRNESRDARNLCEAASCLSRPSSSPG
jgi:hypothetical protein